MNSSDFVIKLNGVVRCELCLSVVLFANVKLTKEDEPPPGLLTPYRVFLEDFRDTVEWCRTDGDQMHAVKITDERLAEFPKWLADPKRRYKGTAGTELRKGRSREEWRAPCFEMSYGGQFNPCLYVQISLPFSWLAEKGREGTESYIARLVEDGFSLSSGYVGLGFAWHSAGDDPEVKRSFFEWLQRFPGLMSTSPMSQANVAPSGLVDLGWVTLLGAELTNKIGGIDALRARCSSIPKAAVAPLPNNGAMIRLGEDPRVGDVQAGDQLDEYRALGKALSPLRDAAKVTKSLVVDGLPVREPGLEILRKWANRFFDDGCHD
jgi:hypothetical protein